MTEQAAADDRLREAVLDWLRVHDRAHDGELPGDLVVVAHFRSWTEDETQVDDYEVIIPAGVSYHAGYGLIAHATNMHADSSTDSDDD